MSEPDDDAVVSLGDGREHIDLEPHREFVRLCAVGQPVALITVVGVQGSAPRGMGAVMTVRGDGGTLGTVGGGQIEHRAIEAAREAMRDGCSRLLSFDFTGGEDSNLDMACAGTAFLFVQPSLEAPELVIFGAGHVGSALAPMAQAAGFTVVVVDDRPGYPDPEAMPRGVRIISSGYPEAADRIRFRESSTYLVVVTHAHDRDEEVVDACLMEPWKYLGMIGSKAKVAKLIKKLGTDAERLGRLKKVRAPIGLDLGGRSPGEIAISIMAELLMVRHGRSKAGPMSLF